MKVESIKIVNFKGIKGVAKELNGHSVYVLGKNAQGKTTFIDAIFMALTGKNTPSEPLRQGEKEGRIEVDLGNGSAVIIDLKEVKGKITQKLTYVEDSAVITESPRARLNNLIGTIDFDPFEFMNKSPKEKLDYFLKIANVNTIDNDKQYKENNDLITLEKNNLRRYDLMPYDEALADKTERPTKEVVDELEAAKTNNQTIINSQAEVDRLKEVNQNLIIEIERLKKEVEANTERVEKGESWIKTQTVISIEPLQLAVDNLDKDNKAIRAAREAKESNRVRQVLLDNIETTVEANKKLRAEKENLINGALEGITGVSFDGEQFLLNGLPFEATQGNTAAQIIAGLEIGLKMIGEVRIARFDGSLLDDENLSSVQKWAENNDLQLFIEMVDRSGSEGLKIEIIEN